MPSIEKEIEIRITSFVNELRALVTRSTLEAVSEALGGSGNGVSRPKPALKQAAPRQARAKGAKRPPAELARVESSLLGYIKKNPGQRIEQIGKAMKTPTKDLTLPIKKLLAGKKIRSKGQKRSTTYSPAP